MTESALPQYTLFIDGRRVQAASELAPALAAGCTMVAKPSDYSPASAVELAALMDEAGFPPGVFNVVTGFGPAVAKAAAANNAYRVVGPDVPFGGFGQSGLGRENGIEAVHEYTQTKAVWVELSGGTRDPFTLG